MRLTLVGVRYFFDYVYHWVRSIFIEGKGEDFGAVRRINFSDTCRSDDVENDVEVES